MHERREHQERPFYQYEWPELPNFYDILGVHSDATTSDIKAAHRKKVLQNHPDRFQKADQHGIREATRLTGQLNNAFEVLKDARKRAGYDAWLQQSKRTSEGTQETPPETYADAATENMLRGWIVEQYWPHVQQELAKLPLMGWAETIVKSRDYLIEQLAKYRVHPERHTQLIDLFTEKIRLYRVELTTPVPPPQRHQPEQEVKPKNIHQQALERFFQQEIIPVIERQGDIPSTRAELNSELRYRLRQNHISPEEADAYVNAFEQKVRAHTGVPALTRFIEGLYGDITASLSQPHAGDIIAFYRKQVSERALAQNLSPEEQAMILRQFDSAVEDIKRRARRQTW